MSEIKILPIFNQSVPGVWDNMLRIRIAAMQYNYNIKLTDEDVANAMAEFHRSWKRRAFNFAFGAYDGDKMIGCINGDVQNKTAFIRHLYVLPEYQGQRVGANLLRAAEKATSIAANQSELVSLAKAEKFYVRMGYSSPIGTNNYQKKLSAPKCCTLPVFYCAPSFERGVKALCHGVSDIPTRNQINETHMPVFSEYSIDSKLRSVGIIDGVYNIIKSENSTGGGVVSRAIDRYLAQNTH